MNVFSSIIIKHITKHIKHKSVDVKLAEWDKNKYTYSVERRPEKVFGLRASQAIFVWWTGTIFASRI